MRRVERARQPRQQRLVGRDVGRARRNVDRRHDLQRLVLVGDRVDRGARAVHDLAEDHCGLVLRDELLSRLPGRLSVTLAVFLDVLERVSGVADLDAALLVHLVEVELVAAAPRETHGADRTGHRQDRPDGDLLRPTGRGGLIRARTGARLPATGRREGGHGEHQDHEREHLETPCFHAFPLASWWFPCSSARCVGSGPRSPDRGPKSRHRSPSSNTTRPPTTVATLVSAWISLSGTVRMSSSRMQRSASLPTSMEPLRCSLWSCQAPPIV